MSDLHPSARDLIDAAKRGEGTLPPEARARVHRSVLRRAMALSAAVAMTSTASAVSKAAALVATLSSPVAIPIAGAIAGVAFVVAFAVKGPGATHPELAAPPPAQAHVFAGAAHVAPGASGAWGTSGASGTPDAPSEPSEAIPSPTLAPPSNPVASIAPVASTTSITSVASVASAASAALTGGPPSAIATRSRSSSSTTTATPATAAGPFAVPIESPPVSGVSAADVPPVTPSGATTSPSGTRTAAADLAGDLELLRQVHAALHGGHADVALSLLDHEGKGLDAGPLAEEAQGARVSALCQLGRVADARAATGRFLALWPTSPLASRLRDGCAALGVNSKPGDD